MLLLSSAVIGVSAVVVIRILLAIVALSSSLVPAGSIAILIVALLAASDSLEAFGATTADRHAVTLLVLLVVRGLVLTALVVLLLLHARLVLVLCVGRVPFTLV